MPSRLMSLLILVYWSIAAFCLLKLGRAPRAVDGLSARLARDRVRQRVESAGPVEHPGDGGVPGTDNRRTVGEAVTASTRQPDGWYEMTSQVDFDAGDLLRGHRAGDAGKSAGAGQEPVSCRSVGQPAELRSAGRLKDFGDELVHLTGQLQRGARWRSSSRGPIPILNQHVDRRSMSRGACSATSWGRSTGCRACMWASAGRCRSSIRSRVRSSTVRAEVTGRTVIHWAGNPVIDFRGRAQDAVGTEGAHVGPHRRRDPASGSAVPVRAAGPRTSRRGRAELTGSAPATSAGRPSS